MAIKVNPPPTLRVPRAFINDPEVRSFIEQQNTIIFQLWNRTGGDVDSISTGEDAINEIPVFSGFMAQLQFIQRQIDGLPEFSMDTTGFTMDSTEWTMDKVLA